MKHAILALRYGALNGTITDFCAVLNTKFYILWAFTKREPGHVDSYIATE